MNFTEKDKERFESKILKTDSCWNWTSKICRRYGYFSLNNKQVRAHRLAYEIYKGPISEGLFVCHNCPDGDNPICVNPEHLFLGTAKDNMDDMYKKKRGLKAKGSNHGHSKLTKQQVLEIRAKYIPIKHSYYKLADEYGVSPVTIFNIVKNITWKDI